MASSSLQQHAIAPATVLRGEGAWAEALPLIAGLSQAPLLLGRSAATQALREGLKSDLEQNGLRVTSAELEFDCCEADLGRLAELSQTNGCDGVLACGGGKVLDAGKLLAHRLGLPCITVPSSAATCAGWTALANLYNPQGCLLYTSPSPRDGLLSRMPSSA